MSERRERAVAVVGLGAILPDALSAPAFWNNVIGRRYSIAEVPAGRWAIADYYDPDPAAPDKSYSKIGGWVRGFAFDWKRFTMPPRVMAVMDEGQQWAVTIAAEALADYGYPSRPLDLDRTGVIFGAAMAGELHYLTNLRVMFPEFVHGLAGVPDFGALPADLRTTILRRWQEAMDARLPVITEDSMPGELANIISGRVANLLNLRGPNFTTDAACASSFAAIDSAVALLTDGRCDAVITGGVDRNMGPSSFVKFCKIGALSATGTRPFGDGADGFVMGEGAAAFVLKRLADAERDGDRIYAVLRGIGGASDGKGKGITAPNPIGQRLAVTRAWEDAGLDPATATLVEAHGTSTRVGDVVEVQSLSEAFSGAPRQAIALGSAKSNVGHLKAGAGAAGLLKAIYALHYKMIPPTLNAERPNPAIEFPATPFRLATEAREWARDTEPRRCGVSAYGFGGTNFHIALEEHVPGALTASRRTVAVASVQAPAAVGQAPLAAGGSSRGLRDPLRPLVALGAPTAAALKEKVEALLARARDGWRPPLAPPAIADLAARERVVLDYGSQDELVDRLQKAERALAFDAPPAWKALASQGVFRGSGPRAGKIAFLFPGQGSQYVNMGKVLASREPVVAEAFAEADAVTGRILGTPLSNYIFVDEADAEAGARAEEALRQTAITQPAVLTVDEALRRLLAEFGIVPDCVMGHSLGEYAALVAAGIMPFAHALEAAAARGREMTRVSIGDNGLMAAVMAPLAAVEEVLRSTDGYVVAANINSHNQAVIGGETAAVQRAVALFVERGFQAVPLAVSHAFHTRIVAPASGPLRQVLDRLTINGPRLPVVGNVTGDIYPPAPEAIKDLLERQIASPVQWVKGLETLYREGVRTFVEVGPKKALKGFVDDVLASRGDVVSLFTNHPKPGPLPTFNQAICGLYAVGWGLPAPSPIVLSPIAADAAGSAAVAPSRPALPPERPVSSDLPAAPSAGLRAGGAPVPMPVTLAMSPPAVESVAQLMATLLQSLHQPGPRVIDRNDAPSGSIVITGTGLGLPGAEKAIMDPANAERILRGEQFIDLLPERFREQMAVKRVTRVVKAEDGSGSFQTIDDTADVIKLAGRPGTFDLAAEYGVSEKLVEALDITTQLAMAAGIDALREAGIPLVQIWRKTTTGKHLPDRWMLPEALREETGVIFASAFPGFDRFTDELERYYAHQGRLAQRESLEALRLVTRDPDTLREIHRRLTALDDLLAREPYDFDRRFIFRVLTMGHSQFAEYIGARGPNAHVNAACASTAQGIAIAEDWIRSGRCRRVVVIGADNVTSEKLMGWVGAAFLATGAAATDDKVSEAAVPFDRRRHGTLLGMGACALVVESQDAVEERGMRGIVELLSTETRNSAFHATRLDVDHVSATVENLVASAERRFGVNRHHIAPETVFVSHETFTPARGGSASAEVAALRRVFGQAASEIVIANTKGFTGHPMGVGIEDVIAVKILEHAIVPPVPNFKEVDPDLGPLTLSRGGRYPVKYAIHLAAGFGSQIALTLTRRIPGSLDRVDNAPLYQKWLDDVSGYDRAGTEVVKRTLRVISRGVPARTAEPGRWHWGTGPARRAPVPGDGVPATGVSQPVPPVVTGATGWPAVGHAAVVMPAPPAADVSAPAPAAAAAPVHAAPVPLSGSPSATASPAVAVPAAGGAATAPGGAVAASGPDPVTARVVAIVAEKTGYPEDMLDLDLDLEADLGVDTVKQAETFAAVREAYGIPRIETLRLRDFPTLKHVVGFVFQYRPDLVPPPGGGGMPAAAAPAAGGAATPASVPASDASRPADSGLADLAAADRVPRRVVTPVVRPPLTLCKPTGVVLGPGSRVVVMNDERGVGRILAERLTERGVTVLSFDDAPSAEELTRTLGEWCAQGPVAGVYWLPALDREPSLAEMDLQAFREQNRRRTKNLYTVMRALNEVVAPPGTFLVSATALGGVFGQDERGASAPLGGGVLGFTKAYKRERPEVTAKAVDFEGGAGPAEAADALLAETLADPGIVEVGYRDGRRWTLTLEECPAADGRAGLTLDHDTVFVVTGAAGGITSAIVADLAAASGGIFYLLDLVELPAAGDPDIARLREGREVLKHALIEEAKARGERPTPVQIDRRALAVERREAALRAVEAVTRAGGTAHYRRVDLLDGPAVTAVIDDVRTAHRRLDVLVHAGGLEISRALAEKEPAEFDLVFDVKADGFFNLLRAAEDLPLAATVVFSSVAGRFGNSGQTDYSAANALLCTMSRDLMGRRPATRAIAIDWTAWGGIGMATRGSIPKVMEMAGIEMLPSEVGIPTVRRELTAGRRADEIVVGGRLGILADEWDDTGGLDPAAASAWLAARSPRLGMVGRVEAARLYGGLAVETTIDPAAQPFLHDHQIDGTPVLPGVMGVEAFAQVASLLCPDLSVATVEQVEFQLPFKFFRMQPATLRLIATGHAAPDGQVLVDVGLWSILAPRPDVPPQRRLHFRGRVRMTSGPLTRPAIAPGDRGPGGAIVGREAIYRCYFHGPAYQVLDDVWLDDRRAAGLMVHGLPPDTSPEDVASLMAPRLIECCFQTAGILQIARDATLGLPTAFGAVRVYRRPEEADGERLRALIVRRDGEPPVYDARVVDDRGRVYVELEGYRTVALPGPVSLDGFAAGGPAGTGA